MRLPQGTTRLGLRLREIRIARGAYLKDFAQLLCISKPYLTNLECGRGSVPLWRAAAWAKVLDEDETEFIQLTLEQLLAREGFEDVEVKCTRRRINKAQLPNPH